MSEEILNNNPLQSSRRSSDTILLTDLDGTLIFSASQKSADDIICEYKDGVPISCVTSKQAELLPTLSGIIPVTTRSIEQYRRIHIPNFSPKYALTDNGGNLLIDGIPDRQWAEASLAITEEVSAELSACRAALEHDPDRSFEIRMVDGLFLFTKTLCAERSPELVRNACPSDRISTFCVGQKLYVLPQKLDKGIAAVRLLERLGFDGTIISAGDSPMDIPLLNIADIALMADTVPFDSVTAAEKHIMPRRGFTQFVTEYYAKMRS
ncbi:MAG: hypothetical protein ACI4KM_05780 [Oscillospiraceae bacterium]